MRLTLIGMSGTGKSQWSKRLQKAGFRRYCCDAMIAAKLDHELRRPDGSEMPMGAWMGFPYQEGYPAREARYLACEIEVLHAILDKLEQTDETENVVLDTTGSVVHTSADLLKRLRRSTTVAYLSVPSKQRQALLRAYMAQPRPILWNGIYQPQPGESHEAALDRCYARLLAKRERLYRRYANVEIDYEHRCQAGFSVADFLRAAQPEPPTGNTSRSCHDL